MKQFHALLLAIGVVLITINSYANTPFINKTCATHEIEHQHIIKNFSLDHRQNSSIPVRSGADSDTAYSVPVLNTDTTYTIQVVVHVVYIDDNQYENLSDELIYSQIDALNRDFNLENSIDHIRPEFLQFIGNPKIRFELAKVDPRGKPTTGITRKKGTPQIFPDWNAILDNVKNQSLGGVTPWAPNRYLNIWVCDLNMVNRVSKDDVDLDWSKPVLGGYANPPQGLPNWQLDLGGLVLDLAATPPLRQGVVLDFRFFGQGNEYVKDYLNNSPYYGLGRTLVHEVGHYLGLRHTWGDYGSLLDLPCEEHDDGIIDTPHEENAYSSYISPDDRVCDLNINSCNVPYPGDNIDYPDMRENFMNYSTDVCYGMFTREQANMMRYALTQKRSRAIVNREIEDNVPTSINRNQSLSASIYPNPATDQLNISFQEANQQDYQVHIFNTLGEVVLHKTILANNLHSTLPIQNLAPGAYIIHIDNNGKSLSKNFIKQ